jgi:hypothetical protein
VRRQRQRQLPQRRLQRQRHVRPRPATAAAPLGSASRQRAARYAHAQRPRRRGSRQTGTPAPCPNNLACASAACFTDCGSDPDCASGYYCGSGGQRQRPLRRQLLLQLGVRRRVPGVLRQPHRRRERMCGAVIDGKSIRAASAPRRRTCRPAPAAPGVPGSVAYRHGSSATVQWTVPSANGAAIDSTSRPAPARRSTFAERLRRLDGGQRLRHGHAADRLRRLHLDVAAHNIKWLVGDRRSAVTPAQRPDARPRRRSCPRAPARACPWRHRA